MRERLMAMLFTSLRYAARRSNVQLANGRSSVCGSVSERATTSATSSGEYVVGLPLRAASSSPATPAVLKRMIQRRTVWAQVPRPSAIASTNSPRLEYQMRRARSVRRVAAFRERASR